MHENDDVETISVVPSLGAAQAAEGMVIEGGGSEDEGSESSSEDEDMEDAEEV